MECAAHLIVISAKKLYKLVTRTSIINVLSTLGDIYA